VNTHPASEPEPSIPGIPEYEEVPPGHKAGFVAIIGKPNVGKSTLLNAYLGTKIAIVSPKPQTTRHRILGVLTRPDAQVIFMDTPGIHQPFHKLGEYMVEVARRAIPDADVVVFLVDASQWPDEEDRMIAELLKEQAADKPVILALNKIDLLKSDREAHLAAYRALAPTPPDAEPPFPWEEVPISAIRGDNLDQLLERIIAHLPEGPRYYDPEMLTDQPMQMIVAELIREKALLLLREEVPHGIAVEITDWVDRNPNLTYIAATIYVEKETHKPIVIGENGQMLKRIGAAARQEIEALLGHAVYLELWVKVRKNWRRDPEQLRRLGYALPRERKGRR